MSFRAFVGLLGISTLAFSCVKRPHTAPEVDVVVGKVFERQVAAIEPPILYEISRSQVTNPTIVASWVADFKTQRKGSFHYITMKLLGGGCNAVVSEDIRVIPISPGSAGVSGYRANFCVKSFLVNVQEDIKLLTPEPGHELAFGKLLIGIRDELGDVLPAEMKDPERDAKTY